MRLRQKIILLIVPIIVLPMIISGWVSYTQLKATAIDKSKEQMETLLEQYALYADSWIHTAETNVRLFSNNELLRRYMVTPSEEERYEILQPLLMKQLKSYQKAYPQYYEFRLIFPDGFEDLRLVNKDIDNISMFEADNQFVKEIMQKTRGVYSRIQRNPDNDELALYVAIALNLKDRAVEDTTTKPRFRGYLVLTINISEVLNQMELSAVGKEGFLFTTNSSGQAILFPRRLVDQMAETSLSKIQLAGLEVEQAVVDVVGGVDLSHLPIFSTHFLGDDGYMKAVKIHEDFILVTWLPFNEINEQTQNLGLIVLGITVLAVLITVLLLFSSLNFFVLRPIQQLRLAAIEIGRGNLSTEVDMNNADEVGDLATSFDEMRKNMQRSHEYLEKLVDDRTLEVRKALESAEQSSRAKSDFLSRMSHELRTPLNAVLGFSQLFAYDQNLAQHQKNNAREINNAGEHLLSLVNEVLDLSKIEAGHLELSIETISLSRVLENCCMLTESLAKAHDIKIEFDQSQNPDRCKGLFVRADYMRIKQVFLNLLSNAVKYNQEFGSVRIFCSKVNSGRVRINISDTGPGLSKDDLQHLFEPFNRLGAELGEVEGTGIGLLITRELVELMGGRLGVESEPGMGSAFWVELDEVIVNEAEQKNLVGYEEEELLYKDTATDVVKNIRILVAEDNKTNQEVLRQQLGFLGYKADFSDDGADALKQWQIGDYQLLLTDIHMPNMDGYQLVAGIQQSDKYIKDGVPIIAITADAMEGQVQRCLDAGMDDYVAKPIHLDVLRQMLAKWLSVIPVEVPKVTVPDQSDVDNKEHGQNEEDKNCSTVIDRNMLTKLVGDDPVKHQHLLKTFITNTPEILDDLDAAYTQRNAELIAMHAHKLKSSSKSMGAFKLSDLCQSLENSAKKQEWKDLEVLTEKVNQAYLDVACCVESGFI